LGVFHDKIWEAKNVQNSARLRTTLTLIANISRMEQDKPDTDNQKTALQTYTSLPACNDDIIW